MSARADEVFSTLRRARTLVERAIDRAVNDHFRSLGFWAYPADPAYLVKRADLSGEPVAAVWKQGDVVFQFFTKATAESFSEWPEHRDAARAYFEEHS